MIIDPSCVEHIIPIEKCLIDMCLNFRVFLIYTVCESWLTLFAYCILVYVLALCTGFP